MSYRLIQGDALAVLRDMPAGSVQTACTSPPYWGLRDYGVPGQLGNEHTPQEYVAKMVAVFREVRRVLRDDGTCWINIGDSYTSGGRKGHGTRVGYKQQANRGMNGTTDPIRAPQPHGLRPKSLCLIPERLALALQEDGWIVRSRIAWTKGSVMPEGVRDRCTSAWEHIWMLPKQAQYYCDMEAVRQKAIHESRVVRYDGTQKNTGHENRTYPGASGPREIVVFGANLRNHWHINPEPFRGAHFATFPTEIPRRCILMGTSAQGCCPQCGVPRERVVERNRPTSGRAPRGKAITSPRHDGNTWNENSGRGFMETKIRTVGWRSGCDHGLEPIPCAVLDPFAGSGTTLMVAEQLGRDSIGIELNVEYCALAERRIQAGMPLTQRRNTEPPEGFTLEMAG